MADASVFVPAGEGAQREWAGLRAELAQGWWLLVLGGVAAVLYGFVVLSFSIKTVWAIAVFAGIGWIGVGITELMASRAVDHHRIAHLVTGVIFLGAGVMALVWPGVTFLVLARLAGWVLLLAGVIGISDGLAERQEGRSGWWMTLVLALVNVLVALWAVRYPGRSIALLVLWVGVSALARGLSLLALGFALRSSRDELTTRAA